MGSASPATASAPSIVERSERSITTVEQLPCDVLIAVHPAFADLDGKLAQRKAAAGHEPVHRRGRAAAPTPPARASVWLQRVAEEKKRVVSAPGEAGAGCGRSDPSAIIKVPALHGRSGTSFNGRTPRSGRGYWGSNPYVPATSVRPSASFVAGPSIQSHLTSPSARLRPRLARREWERIPTSQPALLIARADSSSTTSTGWKDSAQFESHTPPPPAKQFCHNNLRDR